MHILLQPSIWVPYPPNSQKSIPSSNTKSKWKSSLNSSCKLEYAQNSEPTLSFTSVIPIGSSCDGNNLLLNSWPQLLQISTRSQNLNLGQSIHAHLIKLGYKKDTFICNNLINFYSKFNKMNDAQQVFDEMPFRNTVSWTSLINGYSKINDAQTVFLLSHEMSENGELLNEHTCSVILRVCGVPEGLIMGEQVHGFAIKLGLYEDVVVGTSLISMYSKCGCLEDAEDVFRDLTYVDVQCLNLMILEYGKMANVEKVIASFVGLISCGLEPNDYTYTNVISVCCDNLAAEEGRQLHGLAIKSGSVGVTSVANAVITMYSNHGLVQESEKMLVGMVERNLISWTALLSGYVKNGLFGKAFRMFSEMLELGLSIDSSCLATVLDACSESKNCVLGLQLHGFLIKLGYLSDAYISTAMLDFYARNGNMRSATLAFHGIPEKGAASLNAILAGFKQTDIDREDPMVFFNQQRSAGIVPDMVTLSRLLSLSSICARLIRGKSLHAYIIKTGYESELSVSNALIAMYAKCGAVRDARHVFNNINGHDTVSWNTIISAFALSGQGNEALLMFEQMKRLGYSPDKITVLAVLQACSYSGLMEDGFQLFEEMESKYGIRPVFEHFVCMVDLLGRSGLLSEALHFISGSPFSDSIMLWRSLVHICKLRRDSRVGKVASKHLIDLAPKDAGSYMLVANLYAGEGMFGEAAKVKAMMNELEISKETGCSWIEIENKVHRFMANSGDHPAILDLLEGG
ncbi:hypothetical protein Nepgr_021987 [Nepenthes gracilis]|uniref:Pentatricopeptide repeat-containing protein n=1 Tax=Nepenthes gracilis TaxID=150966 RepID=A0AAD3XXY2_NEPGR|nr:hypothetical protein Nepgr_021987 [Nepenthes gracilis]